MQTPPVFVSLLMYAYAKIAGRHWPQAEKDELAEPEKSSWPGFRTLDQLRRVSSCVCCVDGSTLITKARSRAAGAFLRSDADVWFSVDDDVFVAEDVLRRMLSAVRITRGLVALPYVGRDGKGVAFEFERLTPDRVRPCAESNLYSAAGGVGFGCVALHRQAVETLAPMVPSVSVQGRGRHEPYPALFVEHVRDGQWIGEDFSFSELCHREGIPVDLLLDAPCEHAGRVCMLQSDLDLIVGDDETERELRTAKRRAEREIRGHQ